MIKNRYTGGEFEFSCEVFPPKRNDDIYEIFRTLDEIKELNPDFISVTYGAGGSNSKKTATIAAYIQNICEIPALAHMTAVGMDETKLTELLAELSKKGVNQVLALRGDKPRTMSDEEFAVRHYKYASDIIPVIHEKGDFKVAAACYPEVHPESADWQTDIEWLKRKIDCGVDSLITQMFFDNEKFLIFRDRLDKAGIRIPIHAGLMPITKTHQLGTTIKLSGSSVPNSLSTLIAKYGDDDEGMKEAGIDFCIKQAEGLMKEGTDGIHLYCMNKSDVTKMVYNAII